MARIRTFKAGELLMAEGDADTAAYLIKSGWLQVSRQRGKNMEQIATLGPGEIVGELGLAGTTDGRTASVVALTDGEAEIIDRGALIRLVNGPGNRLVPLLAALFSRLKTLLREQAREGSNGSKAWAEIIGDSPDAKRALCNRSWKVTHLPYVFGAHRAPQSVTDLFRDLPHADVQLPDSNLMLREQHVQIEADEGGLRLRLLRHGDYCALDEERIGFGSVPQAVPLTAGEHLLAFGNPKRPYRFLLRIPGKKKRC